MAAAMGVYECLQRAGLQQYWKNLEAAGFSTMEGLSELHQEHFPALGVDDATDRRKLFLLVQTIQSRRRQQQQQQRHHPHHDPQNESETTNHHSKLSNKQHHHSPTSPSRPHGDSSSSLDEKKEPNNVEPWLHANSSTTTTNRTVRDSLISEIPSPERNHSPRRRDNTSYNSKGSQGVVITKRNSKNNNSNNDNNNTKSEMTTTSTSSSKPVSVFQPSTATQRKGFAKSPRNSFDTDDDDEDAESQAISSDDEEEDYDDNDDMFLSEEQHQEHEKEDTIQRLPLPPPRRSRRLIDKSNDGTNVIASTRKSTATARRMSRLSTPKKRSVALTTRTMNNNNTMTQLRPNILEDTSSEEEELDGYIDEDEQHHQESLLEVEESLMIDSHDLRQTRSYESSSSSRRANSNTVVQEGGPKVDTNSFQGKILMLRQEKEEEYRAFIDATTSQDNSAAHTSLMIGQMKIRVVVRKRPMSTAETAMVGNVDVLQPLDYHSYGKMLVYQPRTRVDLTKQVETIPFCFDNVFDEKANNAQIYEQCVQPLIPGLFQGQWATLFAYGQSGSGKTYTIMGSVHTTGASACNYGLYFLAAMDIFQQLRKYPEYVVGVSLFEIYGGKLFDLFNDRGPVKCLEDRLGQVHFPGLSERDLRSPYDLMHWIHESSSLRSTGTTSRNADSSRSHAVLQLHLRKKSDNTEHSRMTLIDLAGSERGADTQTACRTTRMEGAEINTSLLTLKEVIRALAQGNELSHVPFRGSKLTQVLKESFVGSDCRTVMIACVSPNIGNCEHTLNTLRYANRVKERNSDTGETIAESVVVASSLSQPTEEGKADETSNDLDDLLSSQHGRVSQEEIPSSPTLTASNQLTTTGRLGRSRELANVVIRSHKMSMKHMLDLTSREMDLALDSNLSTDDYLRNVNEIHLQQLEICSDLRKQIDAYRQARSGKAITRLVVGESDDDSIEDLRN